MSEHTPGPWFLTIPANGHGYPTIHPACTPVYATGVAATFQPGDVAIGAAPTNMGMPWEQVIANGRVMAAAPNLLAAVELVLANLHHGDRGWTLGPLADPQSEAGEGGLIDVLRAAVALARGEDWDGYSGD